MRVGVRLEVLLLDTPVDARQDGGARQALADLASMLDTIAGAIQRALNLQDKVDATLAKS